MEQILFSNSLNKLRDQIDLHKFEKNGIVFSI